MKGVPERLAALLWPRRCPFCDRVLPKDAFMGCICRECLSEIKRLTHEPPRLPDTEHEFYAVSGAASAFYYSDGVRHAILRCKEHGHPWYAQEFADMMAVMVFGAEASGYMSGTPVYHAPGGLLPYTVIVPVPPRRRGGGRMPYLLARRLSRILGIPLSCPLHTTREMKPQKGLDLAGRLQNTKDAYACRSGTDLSGARVLLVDDIITTGSTVSACALALLQGGAVSVFAVSVAAKEELPPEKRVPKQQQPQEKQSK
ncbi:phosphoribosyltransferase family protein [uncultured Gemmiger sp.]|uniref:ComF family protein n=1 Tax=uncultured Gemmiger sp. TaxID=1623490 RepID=UPI0025D6CA90|nr:phosphoribosyltransferase family protein [uncultured Gemmiger sp.]